MWLVAVNRSRQQVVRGRRRRWRLVVCLLALAGLAGGCGKGGPDLIAVTGTVKVDGKPAPNAQVVFHPAERQGTTSVGTTNAAGEYELLFPGGRKGALAGAHRVTIEYHVLPDGSTPSNDLPPDDPNSYEALLAVGGLKQVLPAKYSDPAKTELKANVSASEMVFDFEVTSEPVKPSK